MRVPNYLKGQAAEFWRSHYARLVKQGILDPDQDTETFVIVCKLWYVIQNTDPMDEQGKAGVRFMSALKLYQAYAKQFGMTPKDRKASKVDSAKSIEEALGRVE
ncbi:hypothetical protein [Limnoglobus roseus]|uniref:Phage terminase small subunit P27 family n=1 Tax=Limnoglobus roseus TaxID=2598579 RepID=A0A5C1AE67_9BACT|nr:hypothetical protein [Limnoglobus roseus]QEL16543.1 hypothetical protein PX52LOC_03503 [Limnoglobus roseus]